jgi:hypothetical protein
MRHLVIAALAVGLMAGALAKEQAPAPKLSAEQIVTKNVAARGGLEAWRQIRTMAWTGHIESAHAPLPSMLFVMQQERPNRTRFEINALGERTQRVFDGAQGWKLRGRTDAQPYSAEELKFAQRAPGLDGPLLDYAKKGNLVSLESVDEIEGHKAYHLNVQLATGEQDQLWIDAKSFLEVRYDRLVDGLTAVPRRVVSVFYRDYKKFDGVQIPTVIETGTGPGSTPDRMVIEKVALNVPLDDAMFSRPGGSQPRKPARLHPGFARAPMAGAPGPAPDLGKPPAVSESAAQ